MADRKFPDLLLAPAPAADGASAIAPPRRARRAAAPVPGSLAEPKDDDDEDDFDNEDYDDWPPAAAAAWFNAAARRADYAGEEDDAEPGPAELEPRAALAAAAAAAVRRGGGARGASDGEDHNSLGAAARKPPAGTYDGDDLDADMLLLPAGGGAAAAAATAAAPAAAPAVAAAPAFRADSCEAMLSALAATRLPATVLPEQLQRHIANPSRAGGCTPLSPTAAAKLREFCRRGGNVEHERVEPKTKGLKGRPYNRFVVSVPAYDRSDESGKIVQVPAVSKAILGWSNLDRWAAGELVSDDCPAPVPAPHFISFPPRPP